MLRFKSEGVRFADGETVAVTGSERRQRHHHHWRARPELQLLDGGGDDRGGHDHGYDVTIKLAGETSGFALTTTFKVFVDCGVVAPTNTAPVLGTPGST